MFLKRMYGYTTLMLIPILAPAPTLVPLLGGNSVHIQKVSSLERKGNMCVRSIIRNREI